MKRGRTPLGDRLRYCDRCRQDRPISSFRPDPSCTYEAWCGCQTHRSCRICGEDFHTSPTCPKRRSESPEAKEAEMAKEGLARCPRGCGALVWTDEAHVCADRAPLYSARVDGALAQVGASRRGMDIAERKRVYRRDWKRRQRAAARATP